MRLTKRVQRTLMASAVAALAFGAAPAVAAPSPTDFGSCIGSSTLDCTTATGHASVSVTGTLSINEMRAMSFGNIAATKPTAGDTIILNLDGTRTVNGGFVGLHGLNANDGGSPGSSPANANSGAQSPGHYTVTTGAETPTQIYISFATSGGAVIDMCNAAETGCDNYHSSAKVSLSGGDGLSLDHFFINQTGSDVYGHYIDPAGQAPGISAPFKPGTAAGSGHDGGTGGTDIVVGGRLTSDGTQLVAGKHVGTFDIMASY